MSESENARTVAAFCDAYNRSDVPALMRLCTEDCLAVYPNLARHDKDTWAKLLADELEAFPDAHIQIVSLIAQGDKVALEFGWKATQKGVYRGVAPSNRTFDFPCVFIFDMQEGKVKRANLIWNTRLWDLHEKERS